MDKRVQVAMSCKHPKKVYLIEMYPDGSYGEGEFIVQILVECAQCEEELETIDLFEAFKKDLAYDLYNLIKSKEE